MRCINWARKFWASACNSFRARYFNTMFGKIRGESDLDFLLFILSFKISQVFRMSFLYLVNSWMWYSLFAVLIHCFRYPLYVFKLYSILLCSGLSWGQDFSRLCNLSRNSMDLINQPCCDPRIEFMFMFVHFHTFIGEMFFESVQSNPFKNIILRIRICHQIRV